MGMNTAWILAQALRAGFDLDDAQAPEPDASTLDDLIQTAAVSKTLVPVVNGLRKTPAGRENALLDNALQAFEMRALKSNAEILSATGKVLGVLQSAGIPVVVMKGPLLQQQLYNTFFYRPSGDLDLLVRRRDFKRCIAVLGQLEFSSGHDISFWWRNFLGQEHLTRPGPRTWTIDLHHRIQQPGFQQPSHPDLFIETPDTVALSGQEIPVPNRRQIPILSAMNLTKTLAHRKTTVEDGWRVSSGAHACDLLVALERGKDAAVAQLIEDAEAQDLRGSAILALRILKAIFGIPLTPYSDMLAAMLPEVSDRKLAAMVLTPGDVDAWPSPQEMLRATCARSGLRFYRELGWYASSEFARKASRAVRLTRAHIAGRQA